MTLRKGILIAFGELFLKSQRVRKIFKKKLVQNLKTFLKKEKIDFKIFPFHERIFLEVEKEKKAESVVKNLFGVSFFAKTLFFENAKLKDVCDFIEKNYRNWIKKGETFAIRLKKGAEIRESSKEIIDEVAKRIKRKVNLKKPKREIFLEARKKGYFLYFQKKKGQGGLPVSTGGKVLALISGGIDSPVASYLMAKRGAENVWLHFHSFPLVSRASIEKVEQLAKIFLKYQPNLKIYFFPFQKIQMEIKAKVLPKYRVLLYRRLMFKIANQIAKKENCKAIVTGESLGQVSSQTLPNIEIISKGIELPILRPLIGLDKAEIINLAKKIKTYQISIKPQEDCCTLFVPKHATAKGNLKIVKELEKKLSIKKIIKETIKEAEIKKY